MKILRAWWIPAEDNGPEREYHWPYINKEFGIHLYYGGDQKKIQLERVKLGQRAILFVDSSVKNFDFLNQFPARSVVVFFVSDETYSLIPNLKIILKKSVDSIFRDYPIRSLRGVSGYFKTIVKSLGPCRRDKLSYRDLFIATLAGLIILCRQAIIKGSARLFERKLKHLPLGYTGWYCTRIEREFGLSKTQDLLTWSINQYESGIPKRTLTFFGGQKGNFDRQVFLRQAKEQGIEANQTFNTFGGPVEDHLRVKAQELYFNGLKEARFAPCPSGNYSAETFRYLESLLLHALPIRPRKVLSDPLFSLATSERTISLKKTELESMTELERMAQVRDQLENFKKEITELIADISNAGSS